MKLTSLLLAVALLAPTGFGRGVRVEFDPTRPEIGPFPSDFLTAADAGQRTGRRMNLPLPDCKALPSDCGEITSINQLDGFNPFARLSVKFSAAINPDTLRDGVFFVWLDPVLPGRFNLGPVGLATAINQVVYDPATNTAYAKPDDMLEHSRRYLVVVTDAVRDRAGDAVEADEGFTLCLAKQLGGEYCQQLADGLSRVASTLGSRRVVGASIYTAQSASAWYELVLPVVNQTPVGFTRTGAVNTLSMANVQGITVHQQTSASGTQFTDTPLPVTPALIAQFGVGSVAFASFKSPRFIGQTLSIPNIPTLTAPSTTDSEEVFFHVWLPKSPMPPRGYPVLIAGHGFTDSRFGMPTIMASANAAGYAVVAMNTVGHGFGPKTTVRFTRSDGGVVEFPAPGRGFDLDGNGTIDGGEGCFVTSPGAPYGVRDCGRQTVVDYLQLIHGIRIGVDLDGDGRFDLDPSSITYFGQSLGSAIGAVLTSISPDISAAVLNVPPGTSIDFRLSQSFRTPLGVPLLGFRQPVLLNKGPTDFEDDLPLRYQPPKLRTTPGSGAIQDFFERLEWLEVVSSPNVLAPHLKQATLPGQPIKRVLFQMAIGDRTVANPSTTALIRAANMVNQTSVYRFDIAKTIDPTLPANPHTFLTQLVSTASTVVALATLQQGLSFLGASTTFVPDVNAFVKPILGKDLFETPAVLPEQ